MLISDRRYLIILIFALLNTAAALSSCGQKQISLAPDNNLISPLATADKNLSIIYPDHNPSIPDGKLVWNKLACAECHFEDGSGVLQADLRSKKYAFNRLPSYQYKFLVFGSKDTPHPALAGQLTNREIWDLIFYVRSLAAPPLSDQEVADLDPIFGANCAVCHGTQGYGDGPLSHNLVPVPANLHNYERLFDRQDEMLFIHLRNGLPPSAMPAWLGKTDQAKGIIFSEEFLKTKLVPYIRHFHVDNKPSALRTWEKIERIEKQKEIRPGKNKDDSPGQAVNQEDSGCCPSKEARPLIKTDSFFIDARTQQPLNRSGNSKPIPE